MRIIRKRALAIFKEVHMTALRREIIFCFAAAVACLAVSCSNPLLIDAARLYMVSFETDCDTEIESYRTRTVQKIRTLEKTDADFIGWYTNSSFSGEAIEFPYELTGDTTLYAKWNQKYLAVFETNGGSDVAAYKTSLIKDEPVTTKADSAFAGWFTEPDFAGVRVTFPYHLKSQTVFYAKWRTFYTVTFVTNGGTALTSVKTSVIDERPLSSRTGYVLTGWFLDEDFSTPVVFPYTLDSDIVLYAKWAESSDTTYIVEHYQQSENIGSYSLFERENMSGITASRTNAVAKFYAGFHPKEFSQKEIAADGSTVVGIYYDRNKYTVRFDAGGGDGSMGEQTFYYGVAQNLSRNTFTHSGFSFCGWADGYGRKYADGESVRNLSATDGAVVTLRAQWFAGAVITHADVSGLDLSKLTDDYTIRVTGSIYNSTLTALAEKIEKAGKPITLDLSDATGITEIAWNYTPSGSSSSSVFGNCYNLEKIILPKSVKTIGSKAFYGCRFSSVEIPDSVTVIGSEAFRNCTELTAITFGNGLQSIGEWAFGGCKLLTSVIMPQSLTSIAQDAFYGLDGLSSVIFLDTTRTWTCTHSYPPLADYGYVYKVYVTNPATNAASLKDKYSNYIWTKN